MIVTCEQCQTRFRLDDEKLKAPFTKVRCSRCQHVFQVAPPQPELDLSSFLQVPAEEGGATGSPPALETEPAVSAPPPETPAPDAAGETAAPVQISATGAVGLGSRFGSLPWLWLGLGGLIFCLALGGYWWYKRLPGKKAGPGAAPPAVTDTVAPTAPAKIAGPPATTQVPPGEDVRDLHIVNYEGLYEGLQNARGGNLLVIRGSVKNTGAAPRGPVTLQATLSNPDHRPIMTRTCVAGLTFSVEELRALEPEKLTQRQESGPPDHNQKIIAPGKTLPFMAIFFGVPKNLAGYVFDLKVVNAPSATLPPGPS